MPTSYLQISPIGLRVIGMLIDFGGEHSPSNMGSYPGFFRIVCRKLDFYSSYVSPFHFREALRCRDLRKKMSSSQTEQFRSTSVNHLRVTVWGLPRRSSGQDSTLPVLGTWVPSLVGELGSHMPHGAAKKKRFTMCNEALLMGEAVSLNSVEIENSGSRLFQI